MILPHSRYPTLKLLWRKEALGWLHRADITVRIIAFLIGWWALPTTILEPSSIVLDVDLVILVYIILRLMLFYRLDFKKKLGLLDDVSGKRCEDGISFCKKNADCEKYRKEVVRQNRKLVEAEIDAMEEHVYETAFAKLHRSEDINGQEEG